MVPACNADAHLDRCLKGLLAAGLASHEILVVDDASTDDTPSIALAHGVRLIRLADRQGPAGARNAGADAAAAEAILFVDADVVVHPDVPERVRDAFDDPDIAAIFGSYDRHPSAQGLVSRYRNLLHHFVHQGSRPEAHSFWTGCGAVRRRPLLAIGGFDACSRWQYIEDVEFGLRLRASGQRIRLDPEMLCTHLKSWSFVSAVRTDLLHRAIPWGRLILRHGDYSTDLNLGYRQRIAVGLTGIGSGALPLSLVWLEASLVALLAYAGVMIANASFLNFLRKTAGIGFAVRASFVHLAHHLAAGLGFAYAVLEAGTRAARGSGALPVRP